MGNGLASSKSSKIEGKLSDVCKPYVEKKSITGIVSKFLIPGTGELPILLSIYTLYWSSFILYLYGLFGKHFNYLLIAFLFFFPGFALRRIKDYYLSRKCKNCGEDFAYVNARKPKVSGTDSKVITTSYYRCKYCGHEIVEVKEQRIIGSS